MRNGAWKTVVRAPDDENRQSTNGTATQRMRTKRAPHLIHFFSLISTWYIANSTQIIIHFDLYFVAIV